MIEENKNILLITSEFPPLPGGIGNHAYNLAEYLTYNKYTIQVIADQRTLGDEESNFDSKLKFKVYRVKLKGLRALMYLKRISLLIKKIKTADVIIASGKFSLWSVALVSLLYRKNYIAVIHGSEVNFSNKILKKSIDMSLKRMSHVVAVSSFTKTLVDYLKLKSIHVIPNGFNSSDWNLKTEGAKTLKGFPKLLTVGNVTERKGQLNVIKHLPTTLNKYPKVHYHCVGLPTEKEVFLNYAKKIGVEDVVTFHGRAKHEELLDYYREADIFVMLSSVTKSGDVEGFGIAVLEANYLKIPAIGSINCGIEDAINNGKSGLLVDYKNAKEFVNAIDVILANKESYSLNAKTWSEEHTWDRIIKKYIDIIELI